jgi:hypothetical protein
MPDDGPPLLMFLIGAMFTIVVIWEISSRRPFSTTRDTPDHAPLCPAPGTLASHRPALLWAFLCGMGAIYLLPWVTVLPSLQLAGLVPGAWFVALLSTGVLYAPTSRKMDP